MTTDGEALRTIARQLDEFAMCESDMVVPVDVLVTVLQTIELRRPCDVSVTAIRSVLYDINDELIRDIARRNRRQTGD